MRSLPRRSVMGLAFGSCVLAGVGATPVSAFAPRPLSTEDVHARSDAHHATGAPYYSGFQTTVSIATVRYKTALALEQNGIVSGAPSPPPPLFATPVVARGGQQTVTLQTKPHAFVAMVVTYPSGKPLVVGPLTATATGRFAYAFRIPRDSSDGPASVVIVAAGVVIQGRFGIISLPRDLAT